LERKCERRLVTVEEFQRGGEKFQKERRNITHGVLLLPERAPSEGPRPTGAVSPPRVTFLKENASKLGRSIDMLDARSGRPIQATILEEMRASVEDH
jgi:hypothetical protein